MQNYDNNKTTREGNGESAALFTTPRSAVRLWISLSDVHLWFLNQESRSRRDFPALKKITFQRGSIIFCLVQGFERRPNSNPLKPCGRHSDSTNYVSCWNWGHRSYGKLKMLVNQRHPTTVFCKISVRRSTNFLEFSIPCGRLRISRWPFHSCTTIFKAYPINSLRFFEV